MHRKTFAPLAILITFVLMTISTHAQPQKAAPAVLTIQVDRPVSKVSPTLYGLMTEEINYSYDGGLYAEMVRNRTFRANRSNVPNWILVEDGDAQAKMTVDANT